MKKSNFIKTIGIFGLITIATFATKSQATPVDIWPSIPFIRGADLCAYQQAYSQTRSEYMSEMTGFAGELLNSGAKGSEALDMLVTFDAIYDKNIRLATQYKYLDVTLENSLKAYLDGYYRDLLPRTRNINFRHVNGISRILNATKRGQRVGNIPANKFDYLDYFAYGSYSFAPNCRGNIIVTITLVGREGRAETFQASGAPATVMSQIASQIFVKFQRTKFPQTLKIGNRTITLLGSLNGSVDTAFDLYQAVQVCDTLGGKLPNRTELEMISSYGDWNGGVTIGNVNWAITSGGRPMVYAPLLRNPSPVRSASEINSREYRYYCVR